MVRVNGHPVASRGNAKQQIKTIRGKFDSQVNKWRILDTLILFRIKTV